MGWCSLDPALWNTKSRSILSDLSSLRRHHSIIRLMFHHSNTSLQTDVRNCHEWHSIKNGQTHNMPRTTSPETRKILGHLKNPFFSLHIVHDCTPSRQNLISFRKPWICAEFSLLDCYCQFEFFPDLKEGKCLSFKSVKSKKAANVTILSLKHSPASSSVIHWLHSFFSLLSTCAHLQSRQRRVTKAY